MAEHQNLQAAIRETRDLFKRRGTAGDWARNLIEGSRRLKTKKEWTKYYAYLANPEGFDPNREYAVVKPEDMTIEPYPEEQVVTEFKNGTETIVHVKNRVRSQDDEKTRE